jgi:hypothetical protein
MNQVFTSKSFWRLYFLLENDDLTEEEIALQFELLGRDFGVREKSFTYKKFLKTQVITQKWIGFSFSGGNGFELCIEYRPSPYGCEINLLLVETEAKGEHQMGWWDLARWHPFCLRFEELELLIRYWSQFDPRWPNPEIPLLLLCRFVGVDDETLPKLAEKTDAALKAIGITELDLPGPLIQKQTGENYRWEQHPDLGWVFTSDDYSCYSLRNHPHTDEDSGEGRFPFTQFAEMMEGIRRALETR